MSLSEIILNKKFQFGLLVLVFIGLRLPALTKLPVFNDESIYIDWAWRAMNLPGFAFFSLLDGKQPVVLWIMGILESLLPDMLWAGRFAAVMWSGATVAAMNVAARLLFAQRSIAVLAACLYCITPIFIFYDRQALYESAVSAVFCWLFVATVWFIKQPTLIKASLMGVIFGVGLWIKSSVFLAAPAVLALMLVGLGKKSWQQSTIGYIAYAFFISQIIAILLYIQPNFQQAEQVDRYIFSISELLTIPILVWLKNAFTAVEIIWWLGSPVVLLGAILYASHTSFRSRYLTLPLVYIGILLLAVILASRALNPRYLVATVSVLPLPAAAFLYQLWQGRLLAKMGVAIAVVVTASMSMFLLLSPERFLRTLDHVLVYPLAAEYLDNWTAGNAGQEAVAYVQEQLGSSAGYVFVRRDAGNPESLVLYSFHKNERVVATYFDAIEIPVLEQLNCIESVQPVFFISRDRHLGGTERFWQEQKRFENAASSVGVYVPKTGCQGGVLEL